MTDKDYKQVKSRINKLIDKWYNALGFNGAWYTDFHFSDERKPNDDKVAAETHADYQYAHATITFYAPCMVNMEDDELEQLVVHELCHILASTYPNFQDTEDATARFERTVNDFAQAIIRARKAGQKNA